MREILFRGKTEISERWVVGDLVQWSSGDMCICEEYNSTEKKQYAVIPETVGQYTGLAFADEETVRAAQTKYADEMTEYAKNKMLKELSPLVEYAKKGMREKENIESIQNLSQIPELSGIDSMLPQLDKIIANNKWLQSDDISADERYITAFLIAKGANSMNAPPAEKKELTTDELMELYNNNEAFRDTIERQRIEQIKQSQQVPPFSASSGAVNAALDIKETPKEWSDASKRASEVFERVFGKM